MKSNYFVIAFAVMVFVSVSCNRSKNVSLDCKDCGLDMPRFEEKYPQKCIEYSWGELFEDYEGSDRDVKYKLEYSSMEEAEWKLTNCFISNEYGYYYPAFWSVFKKVVESDTSSFTYPYDSLIEDRISTTITTSHDGNLRVYSYDLFLGAVANYHNIVQYRWDGVARTFFLEDNENSLGETYEIHTMNCGEKTCYLTNLFYRSSPFGYFGLNAYRLTYAGLEPVEMFKDSKGLHAEVSAFCDEVYLVKEKDNVIYKYEETVDNPQISVYVGVNYGALEVSDRYHKYVWDGKYFVKQEGKEFANPLLCPQLHEYYSNEKWFKTERNLIRIDLMKDKTYRYAAWKAGASMSETPELVIYNGRMDKSCYVFNNKGYEYKVGDGEVVVKKGKDVVGRWNY